MIAALLLAAAAASGPATPFAPPLDRPLRVVLHQERVQAGVTRRYEIERRLAFHRDGAGLVADITVVRVWQDGGGDSGRRFEAAAGALQGRVARFHLAADGTVIAIDDESALWAATLAGIAAIAPAKPGSALTREPAALLAALPVEQRRTILASPLVSIIAVDAAERVPGGGPISVAGNPVTGHALSGTRTVALASDARLHVTIHMQSNDPAHPVSLDRERVIEPATGLVVETRETQSMGLGDAAQIARQQTIITSW